MRSREIAHKRVTAPDDLTLTKVTFYAFEAGALSALAQRAFLRGDFDASEGFLFDALETLRYASDLVNMRRIHE